MWLGGPKKDVLGTPGFRVKGATRTLASLPSRAPDVHAVGLSAVKATDVPTTTVIALYGCVAV